MSFRTINETRRNYFAPSVMEYKRVGVPAKLKKSPLRADFTFLSRGENIDFGDRNPTVRPREVCIGIRPSDIPSIDGILPLSEPFRSDDMGEIILSTEERNAVAGCLEPFGINGVYYGYVTKAYLNFAVNHSWLDISHMKDSLKVRHVTNRSPTIAAIKEVASMLRDSYNRNRCDIADKINHLIQHSSEFRRAFQIFSRSELPDVSFTKDDVEVMDLTTLSAVRRFIAGSDDDDELGRHFEDYLYVRMVDAGYPSKIMEHHPSFANAMGENVDTLKESGYNDTPPAWVTQAKGWAEVPANTYRVERRVCLVVVDLRRAEDRAVNYASMPSRNIAEYNTPTALTDDSQRNVIASVEACLVDAARRDFPATGESPSYVPNCMIDPAHRSSTVYPSDMRAKGHHFSGMTEADKLLVAKEAVRLGGKCYGVGKRCIDMSAGSDNEEYGVNTALLGMTIVNSRRIRNYANSIAVGFGRSLNVYHAINLDPHYIQAPVLTAPQVIIATGTELSGFKLCYDNTALFEAGRFTHVVGRLRDNLGSTSVGLDMVAEEVLSHLNISYRSLGMSIEEYFDVCVHHCMTGFSWRLLYARYVSLQDVGELHTGLGLLLTGVSRVAERARNMFRLVLRLCYHDYFYVSDNTQEMHHLLSTAQELLENAHKLTSYCGYLYGDIYYGRRDLIRDLSRIKYHVHAYGTATGDESILARSHEINLICSDDDPIVEALRCRYAGKYNLISARSDLRVLRVACPYDVIDPGESEDEEE